jgi:hypothetical protein
MQFKSAPNEKEELVDSSRLEQSLSKESVPPYEEFASLIKRDMESGTSIKRLAKPNQPLSVCSASPQERMSPSALQSGPLTKPPLFLSSHKNSMKSQGEKRKKRSSFYPKGNGSMSQKSIEKYKTERGQDKALKLKNIEDFMQSPANSMKGLLSESELECTFHPKVKGDVTESPYIQKYLSSSPYERLSRLKSCKNPKNAKRELSLKSQGSISKQELSSFYKGQKGCAKSMNSPRKSSDVSYISQANYYKEAINNNFKRQQLEDSQYSYKPDILPISKQKKPHTVNELCYEPIKKKQEKLKELRKEILNKTNKEYTFVPQLRADGYDNISSKLKLKDGMKNYLDRVRKSNEEKTIKQKLWKEMKEIEEMIECTHKPKINKHKNSASYFKSF